MEIEKEYAGSQPVMDESVRSYLRYYDEEYQLWLNVYSSHRKNDALEKLKSRLKIVLSEENF